MGIQKAVFILGAGVSRSISPDIPVMADFFEKCLPYLEDPKVHPTIWLAFAVLEQCRCFPVPHRHLENAAAYAIAMHGHLLELGSKAEIAKDSPEYKRAEHSWLEWIQLYQRLCEKEESRIHANLEVVFAEAERKLFESRKTGDVLDGEAYICLVFAVQYLFSHLLQHFPDSAPHAQLADLLSAWLNAHSGRSATFISFNYDVWLERTLQKVGIWHPYRGYQYQFEWFTNLESARRASQTVETRTFRAIGDSDTLQKQPFTVNPSHKVSVLKPHGSLSWYVDEKTSNCVVLLEDTENSLVTVLDKWHLQGNFDFAGDDIVSIYVPFIVPPTQLKRRQHPAFWQIDRRIFQVLSEADVVVSIGWSMPETDRDFQQKVTHAMEHRHKQLERFIICNLDPGEKDLGFYRRMESVFRPAKRTEILGEGFSTDSLERVFDLLREGGEKSEPVQTTAENSGDTNQFAQC